MIETVLWQQPLLTSSVHPLIFCFKKFAKSAQEFLQIEVQYCKENF